MSQMTVVQQTRKLWNLHVPSGISKHACNHPQWMLSLSKRTMAGYASNVFSGNGSEREIWTYVLIQTWIVFCFPTEYWALPTETGDKSTANRRNRANKSHPAVFQAPRVPGSQGLFPLRPYKPYAIVGVLAPYGFPAPLLINRLNKNIFLLQNSLST